jgi:hypothetical protein
MDNGHGKFTGLLGAGSWKAIADIVIQGHTTGDGFLGKEHWWDEEKRGKEDKAKDIARERVKTQRKSG